MEGWASENVRGLHLKGKDFFRINMKSRQKHETKTNTRGGRGQNVYSSRLRGGKEQKRLHGENQGTLNKRGNEEKHPRLSRSLILRRKGKSGMRTLNVNLKERKRGIKQLKRRRW